jgi:hypothetical protein
VKYLNRNAYHVGIVVLAIVGGLLFYVSLSVLRHGQPQTYTQAFAEAILVAVVIALVVEPRMLRHFGEETFWSTFFSQAPLPYRTAIRELASANQFTVAIKFRLTFDWADDERTILKLTIRIDHYRLNRRSRRYGVTPYNFVFESRFQQYPAEFRTYTMSSEQLAVNVDLLRDGLALTQHKPDGRLVVSNKATPVLEVAPEERFFIQTEATTYVDTIGFYPLFVTRPTLSFSIQLDGDALNDLHMSIIHPASGTVNTQYDDIGSKLAKNGTMQVGGIFLTGAAVIISWKAVTSEKTIKDAP